MEYDENGHVRLHEEKNEFAGRDLMDVVLESMKAAPTANYMQTGIDLTADTPGNDDALRRLQDLKQRGIFQQLEDNAEKHMDALNNFVKNEKNGNMGGYGTTDYYGDGGQTDYYGNGTSNQNDYYGNGNNDYYSGGNGGDYYSGGNNSQDYYSSGNNYGSNNYGSNDYGSSYGGGYGSYNYGSNDYGSSNYGSNYGSSNYGGNGW